MEYIAMPTYDELVTTLTRLKEVAALSMLWRPLNAPADQGLAAEVARVSALLSEIEKMKAACL